MPDGAVTLDFSKAQPISPPPTDGKVSLDFSKAQPVSVNGSASIGDQLKAKGFTQGDNLDDQLRGMTAAMSGQQKTLLTPNEQAQADAGKKAGIKAASETTGAVIGGELAPAAKGLLGAASRILGVGAGTGAGNVVGQAGTTGKVDPVEALKAAAKGSALQAVGEGAGAIPSAAKAARSLQDVKIAAGDVPIDMAKPGDTALELYTQSQRGATLPKVVRDFVNRATKPGTDPITYSEAKDFQSNVSRLSANEKMNLTPNTARLLGKLNSDLKGSLEQAADVVDKGQQFTDAMHEYHNAMTLKGWTENAIEAGWKAVLTGAGLYGASKIFPMR